VITRTTYRTRSCLDMMSHTNRAAGQLLTFFKKQPAK